MGALRDQLFLQFINKALDKLRDEYRAKHSPKKGDRFLIKGITYEIGECRMNSGAFVFEISSKIPQEIFPKGVNIEKYFKSVVKLVNKAKKKPDECKMENIIHSASELEIKERDYVKLVYRYAESELYTHKDLEKRLKYHQAKKIPIPNIPGIATPSGKLVLQLVEESMFSLAKRNIQDLISANEEVKKALKAKASAKKPAAKAKTKPKAKAKKKPAAKTTSKKKPARAKKR